MTLQVSLNKRGLYVSWGWQRGFIIKPKKRRMFSEREGYWNGRCIGPLYVRTMTREA